ncbi:serine hydrolase [Actinomadura parmotrematis]|uniref:serine hydrolase n=1 Tax=Actinomadura parmotrematis TaxID=2864039 RepID=UPI003556EB04
MLPIGLANVEHGVPSGPETAFNVGSVAKQITAHLVLLADGDNPLHLDQKATELLPGLKITDITIADLITHRSGLRDVESLLSLAGFRDLDHYTAEDLRNLAYPQDRRAVPTAPSCTTTPTTFFLPTSSKPSTAPSGPPRPTSPVRPAQDERHPLQNRPPRSRTRSRRRVPRRPGRLATHPDTRHPARPRKPLGHRHRPGRVAYAPSTSSGRADTGVSLAKRHSTISPATTRPTSKAPAATPTPALEGPPPSITAMSRDSQSQPTWTRQACDSSPCPTTPRSPPIGSLPRCSEHYANTPNET